MSTTDAVRVAEPSLLTGGRPGGALPGQGATETLPVAPCTSLDTSYRVVQPTRRGSAFLGECDRRGYTELFTAEGRSVVLPTQCKTWGCVVCRKRLLSLFKGKVEVGVSRLGRCAFMTITYQAESDRLEDARCVKKDWAELWRVLRRQGNAWRWLKVTELTKKKTPHHHIVLGTIEGQIRCHGPKIRRGKETAVYIARLDSCVCLAHQFARVWLGITGDSYLCFATPVSDAVGASSYMAKYMEKQFASYRDLLGRRYTTSRDWPAGERVQLKITKEGGWSHIRMWPRSHFPSTENLNPREEDMLERVGDNVTIARQRRLSKKAARIAFGKVVGHDSTTQR